MKISLLHPSRGRPGKSVNTSSEWLDKAGNVDVEILVSVDSTDPTQAEYVRAYGDRCYLFHSTCVVGATNSIAEVATGEILVYLSDDFKCPDNWGEQIVKEFENENRPLVLKVDDCLQKFHVPIITIPIMNRALYNKLGYFWHPSYKSMWVDCDLYWTARGLGAIKNCEHLKFPHEHYSNGKAVHDETYRKSESNWAQGKEVFRTRKLQKFPL